MNQINQLLELLVEISPMLVEKQILKWYSQLKLNKLLFLFLALPFCNHINACGIKVTGKVSDASTGSSLHAVSIFFKETAQLSYTNDDGYFVLDSVCPGEYHITVAHIGCDAKDITVQISKDTFLSITLTHTATSLNPIVLKGEKQESQNQAKVVLNRQKIEENLQSSLSELIENETGVHLLRTGVGISKPIVHGLYGNRVLILNNGIVQSGQQWGNDHSPEIDPFSMDRITIIKGASAIEYGGGNLGSAVLIEPRKIPNEPHLHGTVNYGYETNGKGHNLGLRLEQNGSKLAWRVSGSFKNYGDHQTPNYYLRNTGLREANLALQLEKSWKNQLFVEFFASTYNTEIGILRGSHIGNLTDLEDALTRDEPFFTTNQFSRDIEAPRQEVGHHFVKTKMKYLFKNNGKLELILAVQNNNRKEFDVRRGGRTDIAALSLSQWTYNTELNYYLPLKNGWSFKIGQQNIRTNNENVPGTGILPLIPNYISTKYGGYTSLERSKTKSNLQLGLRYDYDNQNVIYLPRTIPRNFVREENQFHNAGALLSYKYNIKPAHLISFNSGLASRNPAINELYSSGLHQGVSGIEEGNNQLETEQSFKNTIEYEWLPDPHFSFSALAYHQLFNNYIFLQPQDQFRLTIRGAFPVFEYEQTDASITGIDLGTQFNLFHALVGSVKYSYLRGNDLSNNIPLVFMPPNRVSTGIAYQWTKPFKAGKSFRLSDSEIGLNHRTVFEQQNFLIEQDFLDAPPTYHLLGFNAKTTLNTKKYKVKLSVTASNLLNTVYRDFLNRQRYFADEMGRSIVFSLGLKF